MTQPVQEPTQGRVDASQSFGVRQLQRRPAVAPAGGNFEIKVVSDTDTLSTGDGKFIFAIPPDLDGTSLTDAQGYVTTTSSSGIPTVQIRNVTAAVDMLTTKITIDVGELRSFPPDSPANPPVINTANAGVDEGDLIAIDVDVAGTGAKGLGVILVFG